MQRIDFLGGEHRANGVAVLRRSGGRQQVDRIAEAGVRRQARGERGDRGRGQLRHAEACRFARVGRQDARSSGVRDNGDASARGQRLQVEAGGHIEHLVDGVGAHDAALVEERVDCDVARREPGGVAARGARSRLATARLDDDDGLARDRSPAPARRIVADSRTTRGTGGSPIVAGSASAVLQEVVAGDVGLVAEAHERGEPDLPLVGDFEQRDARARRSETRRRCARVAGGARRTWR